MNVILDTSALTAVARQEMPAVEELVEEALLDVLHPAMIRDLGDTGETPVGWPI